MAVSHARKLVVVAIPPYGRKMMRGVGRYIQRHRRWRTRYVDDLETRSWPRGLVADGVLAQPFTEAFAERLRRWGIPVVSVSDRMSMPLPSVYSDNRLIGRLQAEEFLARGFRHLAFAGGLTALFSQQRYEGFVARLAQEGLGCIDLRTAENADSGAIARGLVRQLATAPKPLAVAACSDVRASELTVLCTRHDLPIPEQIAILGVDNDEVLCERNEVALSSLEVDFERIGYEGAALLDRLMNGEPEPPGPTLIPPGPIVHRASTDIIAAGDPDVAQALRFIHDHFIEPIGPADVAAAVAVSRRTLDRKFVDLLGRPVAQVLARCRLQQAVRLLSFSHDSLTSVALASGFTDHNHMGRTFRRGMGLSPSAWRHRNHL